jgi:tetratricopeptide (TPR) repeat protein
MMNRKQKLLIGLVPALLTFLLYLPSLGNGFVNWDDPTYVLENARIRSLSPEFFKFAFTSFYFSNWHPLTLISYAFDYALWKDSPLGYHLVNNVFHSINTGLVFLLTLKVACRTKASAFTSTAAAFITAMLFGLHPQRVESVAWISERKDVLCAFFFLLSLLAYMRYSASARKILWYSLSLVFFILALMSKPMAVTLPVVLLILDFYPLERLQSGIKTIVLEKFPFLALSAASAIITIFAQRSEGALMAVEKYPLWMRAVSSLKAAGFYVFKAVYPAGLAPYYPLSGRAELFDLSFFASAALMAALAVTSIIALRKTRAVSAAWLFFIVTLLPVIGIVQVGSQAAADRYTYIPLIGPFMLAGALLALTLEWARRKKTALSAAAYIAVISIFIVLAGMTIRQTAFWKDSISLWNRQIEVYPGKVPHAYNLRGLAYDEQKKHREAIADFDTAVALDPRYAYAYNNRGNARKAAGEFGKAIDDYLKAASLAPHLAEPYINLSVAYSETGEMELAFEAQRMARERGWR